MPEQMSPTELDVELRVLRRRLHEVQRHDPVVANSIRARIDDRLDERLEQTGVHPDTCRCEDCFRVIYGREMGEMLNIEDLADEAGFGPLGTGNEAT